MFGDSINLSQYFETKDKSEKEYLEIGPLHKPFLKKKDFNVCYMDYRSTDEIKEVYSDTYAHLDEIVDIDYPTGNKSYLETVGEKRFDGVYSSHCLEHTFDIIAHFQSVNAILKDDGRYVLVVPECENSFDLFRSPTTFREAYSVYRGGSIIPFIADSMINTKPYYDKEDVERFWNKRVSFVPELCSEKPRIDHFLSVFEEDPQAVIDDASYHIWTFSKTSLLEIIRDCLRLNLLPFELEEFTSTSNENNYNMFLILKKNDEIVCDDIKRLAQIIKLQLLIEKYNGYDNPLYEVVLGKRKIDNLYIYGTGKVGRKMYSAIIELYDGPISYVVSDGQPIAEDVKDKTVLLSSINPNEKVLILLGTVNRKVFFEMENNLINHGFKENLSFVQM